MPLLEPTAEAAEIALRTQQVLAEENGVANVIDPLGGSWYVEALTDRLEALRQEPGTVLLALEWGPPSGVIALNWFRTLEDDHPVAQISALFVAPDDRRRGIGRMLLKAGAQAARAALGVGGGERQRQRAVLQHVGEFVRRRLGERTGATAADPGLTARDGLVDRRRRDDARVEREGGLGPVGRLLGGVPGPEAGGLTLEFEGHHPFAGLRIGTGVRVLDVATVDDLRAEQIDL